MAEVGEADSVVSEGCIQELLEVFSRGAYKARNALDRRVSEKGMELDCTTLRSQDDTSELLLHVCIALSLAHAVQNEVIHKRCIHLIARDYDVEVSSELFCIHSVCLCYQRQCISVTDSLEYP